MTHPHRILSWILTIIYVPLFAGILCVFHPIQLIGLRFGRKAHRWTLDVMNGFLVNNFRVSGAYFNIGVSEKLPEHGPLLLISNHQSMYDIPMIIWILRRYSPQFIAKKELGRGIPSISLALRVMGSLLIDRANRTEAIPRIIDFGKRLEAEHGTVCIFPEGTRARDGVMKPFKGAGITALLRAMPSAAVVPLVLDGSWHMVRHKLFPVPFRSRLSLFALDPISREGRTEQEIIALVEAAIHERLAQLRAEVDYPR